MQHSKDHKCTPYDECRKIIHTPLQLLDKLSSNCNIEVSSDNIIQTLSIPGEWTTNSNNNKK